MLISLEFTERTIERLPLHALVATVNELHMKINIEKLNKEDRYA
jgi:hypothetical protein